MITATQCRLARSLLQLSVSELAALAQVHVKEITRLEMSEELYPHTHAAIQQALEDAGIEFTVSREHGMGARLRKSGDH